ncbi:MAG: tetratricopeptide repeat protein [Brumimicrobium sp.]
MLNFKEIAEKIQNPSLIERIDLEHFRSLSDKYGYTGVFTQLLLKGTSLYNQVDFEKELNDYAYRIPDRVNLYNLIQATSTNESEIVQQKEVLTEEDKSESVTIEKKPTSVDEKPVFDLSVQTEPEESKREIEIVEDKVEVKIEDEVEETQVKEEKDETSKETLDELEKQILSHAVSSSISLDVDEEIEELKLDRFTKRSTGEGDFTEIEFDLTDNQAFEDEVEGVIQEENQVDLSATKSFSEWMSSFLDDEKSPILEENTSKIQSEKKNIHVVKRKPEFFSPIKKAKESLDESRIVVTETLAKIYAAQGNFPKAIEAYQKLMLIIPEKKSFFALQIESLKRKLN